MSSSFKFSSKDRRNVFCFRNVTTDCIGAFEQFNCLIELSVRKPQHCIIKLTFAGEFSLSASLLLSLSVHDLTIFSIVAEIIGLKKFGGYWFHSKISSALIKLS